MSFTSIVFVGFFALLIGVFVLTNLLKKNGQVVRHIILLLASYIFYAWADWRFAFLMAGMTVVVWFMGKQMESHRKASVVVGVVVPLLVLGVFKYMNFFLSSFGLSELGSLKLLLPLGISFYTFQSVGYVIDVYRGKMKPERLFHVALYISFFPVVTSGPIMRSYNFMPQLKEDRKVSLANMETGVQIFVFGLFKKIVLADRLSVFVNDVYATPAAFSSLTVILGVIAYSLQIYFDFSGYSDMAIGCAKCMGYDIPRNFNLPYLSKNPTEFWRRWHISLSSWFQEYLYFSLGGSKKGEVRTYMNIIIVMLVSGLWHGAGWTFIAWGALNGLGSCVHKLSVKISGGKKWLPGCVAVALNFIFVSLCWVFFRADSFETAMQVLKKVFVWSNGVQQTYAWLIFAVTVSILYVLWSWGKSKKVKVEDTKFALNGFYPQLNLSTVWGLTMFFFAIMMTIGLAYTGGSPFIYAQF